MKLPKRVRSTLPPDDATADMNGAERNQAGRFVKGNRLGGRRRRNRDAIESAFLKAVTADDLGDLARVLLKKAKAGNITALRELLDRVLGRPRVADARVPGLDLGPLTTSASCGAAASTIARSAASGELPLDAASTLAELVAFASDAHRLGELEAAIQELQEQIGRKV